MDPEGRYSNTACFLFPLASEELVSSRAPGTYTCSSVAAIAMIIGPSTTPNNPKTSIPPKTPIKIVTCSFQPDR